VSHLVRIALLCAPIADVGAQRAELLGKRAVARYRIAAESGDAGALNAARRAIIGAALAGHMSETMAAFRRAVVACRDAVLRRLIEMVAHDVPS
jgi:hypothetical protein